MTTPPVQNRKTNKINKYSLIKKTKHYYEIKHVEKLLTITIKTITTSDGELKNILCDSVKDSI